MDGINSDYLYKSGRGGYSVGTITLVSNTTLYIYVGEQGKTGITYAKGEWLLKQSWNGGGSGKTNDNDKATRYKASSGGGSTDISLYGTNKSTNWNNTNHLYSRILVAGGGGGGRGTSNTGGYGGGSTGGDGNGSTNSGGLTNKANTSGVYKGGFGYGGDYLDNNSNTDWTGGGRWWMVWWKYWGSSLCWWWWLRICIYFKHCFKLSKWLFVKQFVLLN